MKTIAQKNQNEGISDQVWKELIQGSLSKNLSVSVNQGKVNLNGSVDSYSKKLMVEELVSKINGVKSIMNNLIVNSAEDSLPNDEQLEKIILDKINEKFNGTTKTAFRHPALITTNELAYWEIFA